MEKITYPKPFLKRMKSHLEDEFDDFINSMDSSPPISLRINPAKASDLFDKKEKVPWCKYGKYLSERPDFVFDPLIHAGAYYVQEASSMLFANAIDFSKDLKILDLCAAPGGKSTLVASLMNKNSILISNEIVNKRAAILYENIVKWGHPNVVVSANRTSDFKAFRNCFDVILVDAPCSGEGMFRKNKKAIREWTPNKPFKCSIDQKNILDNSIHLLDNQGILLYSTCTYTLEENEQILSWFFDKYSDYLQPLLIPIKKDWNIVDQKLVHSDGTEQVVYKCFPHKLKGEGLFLAGFRYTNDRCKRFSHIGGSFFKELSSVQRKEVSKYFDPDVKLALRQYEGKIIAFPHSHIPSLVRAAESLKLLKPGLVLGSFNRKNHEFIPSHEFATSTVLNKKLPSIELNKKQALHYLRKEEFECLQLNDLPTGWITANYEGAVLGWLKKSANRLNNFYPKEWKIKKLPKG